MYHGYLNLHAIAIFMVTTRRHASTVYAIVVCLSVCLSLCRCSAEMAKHRITQTLPHDSPGTLMFADAEYFSKTQPGSPQRRRQMQVG